MAIETALKGDNDQPVPCDLPACVGTGCDTGGCTDAVQADNSCATPSSSPLQFRTPIAQCDRSDTAATFRFFDTVANGLVWPILNGGSTVTVPNSHQYSVGQGVYVVGYGWTVVSAIPSSTQITIQNLGDRNNPAPGTVVPGPVNIVPGPAAKPDAPYSVYETEINAAIAAEVTSQVDAKVDPAPTFPIDTLQVAEGGRLAVWSRSLVGCESDTETTLMEQLVQNSPEGFLGTIRQTGCDPQSLRQDILMPTSAGHGDVLLVTPEDYCGDDPPKPKKMSVEVIDGDSTPSSTSGLLAYRTEDVACGGGNVIKKIWQRLAKLVFHDNVFNEAVTTDDTLRVIVSNKAGTKHKIAPLTLGDGEVLAGDGGGGVKVVDVLDIVPPSSVAVEAAPITMVPGPGPDSGVITPNSFLPAPDCATHAIVEIALRSGNNTYAEILIAGIQYVDTGATTSNPDSNTTVAYVPLPTPTATISWAINETLGGGGVGILTGTIKLIGYQCNRSM